MNDDNRDSEPWKKDGHYYCKERNGNDCPKGLCGTGRCPIDAVYIACDLAKGGHLEEAEKRVLKVIETDPEYECAWGNLGGIQLKLGNHMPSRVSCLRALRLYPGYKMASSIFREANHEAKDVPGRREMNMFGYLMALAQAAGDVAVKFMRDPYPIDVERGKRIGDVVAADLDASEENSKGAWDASEVVEHSLIMSMSEGFKVALAYKIAWPRLKKEVADFLKEQDPTVLQDSWRTAITLFTGEIYDARKKIVTPEGDRIGGVILAYARAALAEMWEWQNSDLGKRIAPVGLVRRACQGAYCFGIALGESMEPTWDAAY